MKLSILLIGLTAFSTFAAEKMIICKATAVEDSMSGEHVYVVRENQFSGLRFEKYINGNSAIVADVSGQNFALSTDKGIFLSFTNQMNMNGGFTSVTLTTSTSSSQLDDNKSRGSIIIKNDNAFNDNITSKSDVECALFNGQNPWGDDYDDDYGDGSSWDDSWGNNDDFGWLNNVKNYLKF